MFNWPLDSYSANAADYFRELCHKDSTKLSKWSKWPVSVVASVALAIFATVDVGITLGKIVLSVVPLVNVKRPSLIYLAGVVELLAKTPFMFCANLFNFAYFPATEAAPSGTAQPRKAQAEVKETQAEDKKVQEEAKVAEDRKQAEEKTVAALRQAAEEKAEAARKHAYLEFVAILNRIDHRTQNEFQKDILDSAISSGHALMYLIHHNKSLAKKFSSLICDALDAAKRSGFDINQENYNGTLLARASDNFYLGDVTQKEAYKKILLKLLELGADPKICDRGKSPLTQCIDDIELVERLLEAGAPPNKLHHDDFPLRSAITSEKEFSLKVMVLLLHYGADPEIGSKDGFSLVNLAREEGFTNRLGFAAHKADKKALLRGLHPNATVKELTAAAAIFRRFGYDPLTHLRILDSNGRPHFEYLTDAKMQFLQDLIGRFDALPAGEGERKERAGVAQPLIIAQAPAGMLRIKENEKEEMQAQPPTESERKERQVQPPTEDETKESQAQPPPQPAIEELLAKAPDDLLWLTYSSLDSTSDWVQLAQVFEWEILSQKHWERINVSAKQRLERFGVTDCGSIAPLLCLFQNIYDSVYPQAVHE